MKRDLFFIFFLIIFLFVSISGCTTKKNEEKTVTIGNDLIGLHEIITAEPAQEYPYNYNNTFYVPLKFDNITQVIVNISILDGDDGTNPDIINNILFGPEKNQPVTMSGGDTPFKGQLVYNCEKDYTPGKDWFLIIDLDTYASDDQWPGPILWRGVPDNGFELIVDIKYSYIKESV
ncbi:MAG: hypothetical protein MUC62_09345 [Candidatus Thermoplasmatota archaeon]|nr:hypothetical protein [Candidatus Thermoplasmatota archaeon]